MFLEFIYRLSLEYPEAHQFKKNLIQTQITVGM